MSAIPRTSDLKPILSVDVTQEHGIVAARQRARQLAVLLGFGQQDQTRLATAVSEVSRNAYQYAKGGRVEFSIELQRTPQFLWIEVRDEGPGIENIDKVLSGGYISLTGSGIGLAGARRLMDSFSINSEPGRGTSVRFGKAIPASAARLDARRVGDLSSELIRQQPRGAADEMERQNRELLQTLDTLITREAELERRQQELRRLNLELEETNRGVVALYAELEEKAIALRRADEMKSRFISNVSHEFRTPVNSILALTRLLLRRTDGELTGEQEKQVSYVEAAARQLAEIVNDLLDLAKVEAGKTEIRLARVDVSQFLGATRALMRPLVTNESVALIFEDPPAGLEFESDESKLGQILRNLISNSLKFTQTGDVRVTAQRSLDGNSVVFQVKDTGIGIAREHLDRIFQEFSQIDSDLQRKVKGTGLGLPLSRRLADLLGGTLTVESELGQGSTFTLTLPVGNPGASSLDEAHHAETQHPGTILVIDDDETARYLTRQLFRGTQYRIIESAAGEAVERARFEAPTLILLDLIMPDRSGFDVLNDLKADEFTRKIPVVVHSSKALNDADYARLDGKHTAMLPKGPIGRSDGLVVIRKILKEPDLFSTEPEFRDSSLS